MGLEFIENGDQGRLGLQQVLAGFDDQQVYPAIDQPGGLAAVSCVQFFEGDMSQRGQLGAGTHGAGHEAGVIRGREVFGHLLGQPGRLLIKGLVLVVQAILGQYHRGGAETVGLHHVASHFQEGCMQLAHHVGPGAYQDLVTTLVIPEVVQGQIEFLEIGSRGAIEDDHALSHEGQEGMIFGSQG